VTPDPIQQLLAEDEVSAAALVNLQTSLADFARQGATLQAEGGTSLLQRVHCAGDDGMRPLLLRYGRSLLLPSSASHLLCLLTVDGVATGATSLATDARLRRHLPSPCSFAGTSRSQEHAQGLRLAVQPLKAFQDFAARQVF